MQLKMLRQRAAGLLLISAAAGAILFTGCSGGQKVSASNASVAAPAVTVGVATVARRPIARQITISSELVPFQEIDLYAKESGYLKQLLVDYGTHVKKGDLVATLEIPELQMQIAQDEAAIKNQQNLIDNYQHQVERVGAQVNMYELQFKRLKAVADSEKGLVAQQEVDDADDKYLAAEAQLEAAKSSVASAQNELAAAQAKEQRDRVLFDYSKVYAPFSGIITQRYANEGTLVQAGTSSSTNVLPIAKLSEDDKFRLVIPVPESYVKYIHLGDPVKVRVSSLNRDFPGRVARISADVNEETRTMHTEVDVENPDRVLLPGLYADATITLEKNNNAIAVPIQALDQHGESYDVYVVTPENKIEVRPVQVALQGANFASIASGLREGEKVVVGDRASLKADEIVKPQPVNTEYEAENQ